MCEQLVWDITAELGWPWSPLKHFPFNTIFTYIGFMWDLDAKTVHIPKKKKPTSLPSFRFGMLVTLSLLSNMITLLGHLTTAVTSSSEVIPIFLHFIASVQASKTHKTYISITKSQDLLLLISLGGAHICQLNGAA
jgi:hypothetical protein